MVSSSGYATSGTYQRSSVAGKAATSGVNMRQTKSIGGVQRPVSAVLPQSYAVNRRQETMDSYSDVVRNGELGVYVISDFNYNIFSVSRMSLSP